MRGLALWNHRSGAWLNLAVGDDQEALAIKVKLGGAEDGGRELLLGNGSGKFQAWCSERFWSENRERLLEAIGDSTS